jgi:hypothetical protein
MKSLFIIPSALLATWLSAGAQTPQSATRPPKQLQASTEATSAAPAHLVYSILRNGKPIGKDVLDIDNKGHVTSINRSTDIQVNVLFMNAYSYRYTGTETWQDGQLTDFISRTDDNGTVHNVALHASGDPIQVDADGHHSTVAKTIGLDDFWKPQLLSKTTVLDTSDGHEMTFVTQDMGMQTVAYRGADRPAHHFKLTGGISRDLWFDGDTPVRFQIKAPDGSMIVSQLQ